MRLTVLRHCWMRTCSNARFFVGSALLVVAVQWPAAKAEAALIAAYSFDATPSSTVPDVSAGGNTLLMSNGATATAGRYGSAMSFDGRDDATIAQNYNATLNLTNNSFTLSAWIYPRTNGGWQMIVNKPYTNGHSSPYFDWSMHRETGSGRISAFLGCEGRQRTSNASTPINTWTHVAVTYDGATLRHYINGVLDRSTAVSCAIRNDNSRRFRVGTNGAGSETMNGMIDDVRIYNSVLSATEIGTDMSTPLGAGSAPPPQPDTTAPSISITSPVAGSNVGGIVSVVANATDNIGIAAVAFSLDGQALAQDSSTPYSMAWNTASVGNGAHTLSAVASDAAGNSTFSSLVVYVQNQAPAPTLSLSVAPASVASGGSSTLSWSTTGATTCDASGAWSGSRPVSGTANTGPLISPNNVFALTCAGADGSVSRSVVVTVSAAVPPTVSLIANPGAVQSGSGSTLTWSSTNATSCTASGAWSGARATSGSAGTGALTTSSSFSLTCTGSGGSASATAAVSVVSPGQTTGLDFPGSGWNGTMRFKFSNPLAIYPATYIWKVYPRQQKSYYTTFFWGNDDGGGDLDTFWWDDGHSNSYYGAHPYPNWPDESTHRWEIATDRGGDFVSSQLVQYNRWYTQALVAWVGADGRKHTVFYWDLPDTTRVVTHVTDADYGNKTPPAPALTFGDAPWNPGEEIMNGVLRGIQVYSAQLSMSDILSELNAPMTTSLGAQSIWYLNVNPTPGDISDKSGRGHHPNWVGNNRPTQWNGQ